MSSRSDGRGNTSNALLPYDKKALQEARSYANKCGSKIAEEKKNFADKGGLGLWWDAKGLFNTSNVKEVTDYMERYNEFYKEIDAFSIDVEEGDTDSYEKLLKIYDELEELEKYAESDVENNQSKTVCQVLREFLNDKYKLDHNLKKVECVVLKQKIRHVEQTFQSSKDAFDQLREQMGKFIEENREIKKFMETMRKEKEELAFEANKRSDAIRKESDEKVKQIMRESEARIREIRKENDELRLAAEKIRQESDESLRKAVEEVNKRSEARMQKMAEKNNAALKKLTKMLEDMNFP